MVEIFRKFCRSFMNAIENARGSFITFHERPVAATGIGQRTPHISPLGQPRATIVIQGPIVHERNFTLETIHLYRKSASTSNIVLSTWQDEDVRAIEQAFGSSIVILKNEKPASPGPSNINFQIVSAQAGIKAAKAEGAQYILKTRTDQRMYLDNPMAFMANMIERFPLDASGTQRKRILSISLDTYKFRLYGVSDMFIFGDADDVLAYWSADQIDQSPPGPPGSNLSVILSESYLCSEFLKKMGKPLVWNVEDSWRALSQNFCIIDEKMVDLYWFKYGRHHEYRYPSYSGDHPKTEVSFADWILMGADGAVCDVEAPRI